MEKSESIKSLSLALLKFNAEVGKIGKKSTNPFFKSKYASLPDILSEIAEPLQKSGLVIIQLPDGEMLSTMLVHAESGEYITATSIMKPVKNDPQSMGSAITYQRRYSIASILNLNIDEDDDGNRATKPPAPAKQPEQSQPKQKKQKFDINNEEMSKFAKNSLFKTGNWEYIEKYYIISDQDKKAIEDDVRSYLEEEKKKQLYYGKIQS